jgi:hypothetical protein
MENILLKLDVTKIDKSRLFEGKKGVYLDAVLIQNRDGQQKWGQDGFVIQSISKEERDNGERGTILGNWRFVTTSKESSASTDNNTNNSTDNNEQAPF